MATNGEVKSQDDYMKRYEEWRNQKKQKRPLNVVNRIINPIAQKLDQVKNATLKRQNTFSNTRRSPRLKENVGKVNFLQRSHSVTARPTPQNVAARTTPSISTVKSVPGSSVSAPGSTANSAPFKTPATNNSSYPQKTPATKACSSLHKTPAAKASSSLHRTQSETAASRQERLQEWKRKKEEERQQQLEKRLQAKTPKRDAKTPAQRPDSRPPFRLQDSADKHTTGGSSMLDERRQTIERRRLTLGTTLDRRKSYGEALRQSGTKPVNTGIKRAASNTMGPSQALIKRKKEENRATTQSSVNIQRSKSFAGQKTKNSAAASLERRKSYGKVLRAVVVEKSVKRSLSSLHREKQQRSTEYYQDEQDLGNVQDNHDHLQMQELDDNAFQCVSGDNLPEVPAGEHNSSRRETFTPDKAPLLSVEELKASTGPGTRSTPTQAEPATKLAARKSARKSILKPDALSKTPSGQDRKVKFRTPSSVTPGKHKPNTCSWTPQKEHSFREKLDSWLVARGRTPTRYRHLHCFDEHICEQENKKLGNTTIAGLSTDELHHQQEMLEAETKQQNPKFQLQELLSECTDLVEAGCPGHMIVGYLDRMERHIPSCRQSAAYWTCRARVAEEEDQEAVAVDMYESAVIHGAQPARDIVEALKGFVTRMEDRKKAKKEAAHTPWKPHKEHGIEESNIINSSSIKYCVSKSTPLMKRLSETGDRKGTPRAVITPVRRSTRLSHSHLPGMLQDHDDIIDSLDNLPPGDHSAALFHPNRALEQEFEEAMDEDED